MSLSPHMDWTQAGNLEDDPPDWSQMTSAGIYRNPETLNLVNSIKDEEIQNSLISLLDQLSKASSVDSGNMDGQTVLKVLQGEISDRKSYSDGTGTGQPGIRSTKNIFEDFLRKWDEVGSYDALLDLCWFYFPKLANYWADFKRDIVEKHLRWLSLISFTEISRNQCLGLVLEEFKMRERTCRQKGVRRADELIWQEYAFHPVAHRL